MTASTRKSRERQRRKDAGLVRVEVYVRPEDRQIIRDMADRLTDAGRPLSHPGQPARDPDRQP